MESRQPERRYRVVLLGAALGLAVREGAGFADGLALTAGLACGLAAGFAAGLAACAFFIFLVSLPPYRPDGIARAGRGVGDQLEQASFH